MDSTEINFHRSWWRGRLSAKLIRVAA